MEAAGEKCNLLTSLKAKLLHSKSNGSSSSCMHFKIVPNLVLPRPDLSLHTKSKKVHFSDKYISMYTFVCGHTTGFPDDSVVRNLPTDARDVGSIPGMERSPRGENGKLLQYSCLGNPMDRSYSPGGLQFMGSQKSQTQLSN